MLKISINQSRQAAIYHSDGFSRMLEDPSDRRIAYNLKNLTRVAQSFHSSASSTASTIFNGTLFGNLQSDTAISIRGGLNFTPNKRQQIDPWVKQQRRLTLRRQRKPLQRIPSSAAVSIVRPATPDPVLADPSEDSHEIESNMSETADDNEERAHEAEFQSYLLSGHGEVAQDSMLNLEFAKAQSMLELAIQRRTGSTSEDSEFKQLQIQLAICYFFQHKWQLAEPLVNSIAKSKINFDPIVCNLLHALAIANLVERRFEKAIVVCTQALYGKRRLKRDFPRTSETECNETLGLLATIYDAYSNRLDAEAMRRKISKGFSYYHPENEVEFIVKHPKLCPEVFGGKISVDWRRPQIPAASSGEDTELPTNLPTIKEEDTPKGNTTTKKPLQTFQAKLSLYQRVNLDSGKEVVASSLTNRDGNDEAGSLYGDDRISSSPSRPRITPKRSFARRVVRFLGTLRERPVTPRDTEDTESPSRPRFGNGFWPRSEGQFFKLKKSKARFQKRASDEGDNNSFPFLRGVRRQRRLLLAQAASSNPPAYEEPGDRNPRPWRYSVDTWLRTNPQHGLSRGTPQVYQPSPPTTTVSWPNDEKTDYVEPAPVAWVPASRILLAHEIGGRQVHELMDTSRPSELMDTSLPVTPPEAALQQSPSSASIISRASTISRVSMTIDDDGEGQGITSLRLPSIRTTEKFGLPKTTPRKQWLTVAIPKFVARPGGIPLVAHYPAERSSASAIETDKGGESLLAPGVTNSSLLGSAGLPKEEVIAKVFNDIQGEGSGKLVVEERLDTDFDELMRKEDHRPRTTKVTFAGSSTRQSGKRQGWVPASYFKDLSPSSDTVGVPLDSGRKDLQKQSRALGQIPSESSEIDEFSRAFRKAISPSVMNGERKVDKKVQCDAPKTRYQLVDKAAARTVAPPVLPTFASNHSCSAGQDSVKLPTPNQQHNPNAGYFDIPPQSARQRGSAGSAHWSNTSDIGQVSRVSNASTLAELDGDRRSSGSSSLTKALQELGVGMSRMVSFRRRGDLPALPSSPSRTENSTWKTNTAYVGAGQGLGDIPEQGESKINLEVEEGISNAQMRDIALKDLRSAIIKEETRDLGQDITERAVPEVSVGNELPKLERTQNSLSLLKLMEVDEAPLSEQINTVRMPVDAGSISPCLPPQQLGRKFSWETMFEDDINSTVSTETEQSCASSAPAQLEVVTRKFSWCSEDSQQVTTPDLVRTSSLSTSSSSSPSLASSATSTSSGPMLKYDRIKKDLIIVSNDSTSSLPETQNLDDVLAQLSANIHNRKSKRRSAEPLSPFNKLELRLKSRQPMPESVATKEDAAAPSALQPELQANESMKALPFIHPRDIYRRLELESASIGAASEENQCMMNRRHPLRERRKQQKRNREAAVLQIDDEKMMLYPGGMSSLRNSRIGVAF